MKQIITCICLLFATAMVAQTTPTRSSEARKTNMSRTNARTAISKVTLGKADGPAVKATKGSIGVQGTAVEGGVAIEGFAKNNSMARAAKLKKGDVITAINNVTVTNPTDIEKALAAYQPGDVVTIYYNRGSRKLTKDVRVGM